MHFENVYETQRLVTDQEHAKALKHEFATNGIALIKIDGINCRNGIEGILKTGVFQQPWSDEYQIRLRSKKRPHHVLNPENTEDFEEIYEIMTQPMDNKTRKYLEDRGPLHMQFGAPCDPQFWWQEERLRTLENEGVHRAFSEVLDTEQINADIQRSIFRYPGQGENAFLHWDQSIPNIGTVKQICGKLCYNEQKFVCVPGSHTPEFLQQFKEQYAPYYNINKKCKKFGLDPTKPDPMGLWEKQTAMIIPAGHLCIWSVDMLHGHQKSSLDSPIHYGTFLGAAPECNFEERKKRKKLYDEGGVPDKHPSGDPVHFYPLKYKNFPKVFDSRITKRLHPKLAKTLLFKRKVKGQEKEVWDTKGWGWTEKNPYRKYKFSRLGKRMLGIRSWSSFWVRGYLSQFLNC